MKWVDQTKEYTDKGYNNKSSLWDSQWAADQGPTGKVFGFFYSTWGINFTLLGNSLETPVAEGGKEEVGNGIYGDYAVCEGPQPYYWGGTWICGAAGSDNIETIKDVMQKLTCDEAIMKQITMDTQDYTNNEKAMERDRKQRLQLRFPGRPEPHRPVCRGCQAKIDMSNAGPYDQGLNESFQNAFKDYFTGNVDEDTAKANFETAIKEKYPELTDVVLARIIAADPQNGKVNTQGRAGRCSRPPLFFPATFIRRQSHGRKAKKKGSISYAKWGYIFIAPFFIIFAVFQLIPLASTIYYSFFEYYRSGLKIIGPNFVGLKNYITLFATDLPKYFGNTLILWIIGFIPQIAISLLLAAWFTDLRLKLKGQTFFKTVIYMPNLIMASAFAMLFFALFSDNGPVNAVLHEHGHALEQPISFLNTVWGNRGLIGLMNFLMWFGNTTIMLMAAIMGVDPTLYEAAELDGCTPNQMFWKITIPAHPAHPRVRDDHLDDRRSADV